MKNHQQKNIKENRKKCEGCGKMFTYPNWSWGVPKYCIVCTQIGMKKSKPSHPLQDKQENPHKSKSGLQSKHQPIIKDKQECKCIIQGGAKYIAPDCPIHNQPPSSVEENFLECKNCHNKVMGLINDLCEDCQWEKDLDNLIGAYPDSEGDVYPVLINSKSLKSFIRRLCQSQKEEYRKAVKKLSHRDEYQVDVCFTDEVLKILK